MKNRHGDFIWYELMTGNPAAASAFYGEVVGWETGGREPGEPAYSLIQAKGHPVGGMLTLSDTMCQEGAVPGWLGYVAVDDVNASLANCRRLGGSVLMDATDIPGVGRIALLADPHRVPLYIMRPEQDGASKAFSHDAMGHCAWNELTSEDQERSLRFYRELFGWENRDAMPMGEFGDYQFINQGDDMIGAVSPPVNEGPTRGWTFYFHVPDIDAAVQKTRSEGGQVLHGPHEIPGGEYIIIGSDPEGATFALVGARKG